MATTDADGPGPVWLRLDGSEPCRGRADIYFPDRRGTSWKRDIAEAVKLCASCHQQAACAAVGHRNRERDGVWGGVDMFYEYGPEAWRARKRQAARDRLDDPGQT